MKKYIFGFIALVILILIYYQFYTPVNFDNTKYVKIARQNIKVELAITPAQQAQGLSFRPSLSDSEGMLFVFSTTEPASRFWMKDMNFPIDIIWLAPTEKKNGKDLQVVYIKKDARPESYPETYGPESSDHDALYVLEVTAGFADKNNLQVGDRAEFTY